LWYQCIGGKYTTSINSITEFFYSPEKKIFWQRKYALSGKLKKAQITHVNWVDNMFLLHCVKKRENTVVVWKRKYDDGLCQNTSPETSTRVVKRKESTPHCYFPIKSNIESIVINCFCVALIEKKGKEVHFYSHQGIPWTSLPLPSVWTSCSNIIMTDKELLLCPDKERIFLYRFITDKFTSDSPHGYDNRDVLLCVQPSSNR
jgi:hypothetical protein